MQAGGRSRELVQVGMGMEAGRQSLILLLSSPEAGGTVGA